MRFAALVRVGMGVVGSPRKDRSYGKAGRVGTLTSPATATSAAAIASANLKHTAFITSHFAVLMILRFSCAPDASRVTRGA